MKLNQHRGTREIPSSNLGVGTFNMKKKVNFNVIAYSFIAFIFIALTFLVDWKFIIGAVVMMFLNQRELFKN